MTNGTKEEVQEEMEEYKEIKCYECSICNEGKMNFSVIRAIAKPLGKR